MAAVGIAVSPLLTFFLKIIQINLGSFTVVVTVYRLVTTIYSGTNKYDSILS